jgi:hypothetical protein
MEETTTTTTTRDPSRDQNEVFYISTSTSLPCKIDSAKAEQKTRDPDHEKN